MSNSPRHAPVSFAPPDYEAIERDMATFRGAGFARRTIQSYDSDMRVFRAWCEVAQKLPLPATPETVHLYVVDLIGRGRKITTAQRHAFAIHHAHRQAGLESPCGPELRLILAGARRILCQRPNQKEPLQVSELQRIVETLGKRTPIAARNSAILVFGFASALRRSNLVSLTMDDLSFGVDGVLVRIRHEKQDRKGRGRTLAVPPGHGVLCPIAALQSWLRWRGNRPGPLFTHVNRGHVTEKPLLGNRLGQIVQECVGAIGLDAKRYGAHSLRSGFVTEALKRSVNELAIIRQTGHASVDTLGTYFRPRDLFAGNAAGMIGL